MCAAGLACDPKTGEVIPCHAGYVRPPSHVVRYAASRIINSAALQAVAALRKTPRAVIVVILSHADECHHFLSPAN